MGSCQKLLQLRSGKKVTQEAVVTVCGTTLRQHHRFEKSEQKPGFDSLRNTADFYGVSVDWLVDRTGRREVWR